MSIELTPAFQANIQAKDQKGNILFTKTCSSEEEARIFLKTYGTSRQSWGVLQGLAVPFRTQNIKDLATDLFLPTFIHSALRIDNIALKLIASIFAIALDLVTMPIRFITTPFRMSDQAYYYPEEKHPLALEIAQRTQPQIIVEDPVVDLCYEMQKVHVVPPTAENQFTGSATKSVVKGTLHVALRTLPGGTLEQPPEVEEIVPCGQINFGNVLGQELAQGLSSFLLGGQR